MTKALQTRAGRKSRMVIAGASGFVGSSLGKAFAPSHEVIGLSRRQKPDRDGMAWRQCDLYSLKDCERALQECDVALYLVHSMSMPATLTQASFEDLDLILADNFARAAALQGVSHIVYLSGLIEEDAQKNERSAHLQSRYEVEKALASQDVPVTTLRAGLVVGEGGSSLDILTRLVRRLPLMLLPNWTQSKTQPIALQDVQRAFEIVVRAPKVYLGPFDIGGPDVMTYEHMLRRTAAVMGLSRRFLSVPFFTPKLSSLWVSLITGCPRYLVTPLVQSLRHPMVCKDNRLQRELVPRALGFEAALHKAIRPEPMCSGGEAAVDGARAGEPREAKPSKPARTAATSMSAAVDDIEGDSTLLNPKEYSWGPNAKSSSVPTPETSDDTASEEGEAESSEGPDTSVPKRSLPRELAPSNSDKPCARSVQRLHLPVGRDAQWVALHYLDWLDRSPFGVITTQREGHRIAFFLRFISHPLLSLRFEPSRSRPDRALFYVEGGTLVDPQSPKTCRFEFRETVGRNEVLAAIHDFYPTMPWYIYRYTQAVVHLWVMWLFGWHLRRLDARS